MAQVILRPSKIKLSSSEWKTISFSVIGNALDFYGFTLFGAFALTFSRIFFIEANLSSLITALSIFAVAFFVRPFGALVFGYYGDKFGRKKSLTVSIILMGAFTFLIGCIPTYEKIGYWAPVLLLMCRMGQGFCLGGENNGSAIFVLEHLKESKGFASGLILTGGAIGTLMATALGAISNLDGVPEWFWRLPFLMGFMISILGKYIQDFLEETPNFLLAKSSNQEVILLNNLIKHHLRPFLCTIGVGGVNGVLSYTLVVYIGIYLTTVVQYPVSHSLLYSCIGLIIFAILSPLIGHLADKIGEKKVMLLSCFCLFFFSFLIFFLIQQKLFISIIIAVFLSAFMMATFNSPTNAYLNNLFPIRGKYTGISLGYAIGIAFMGGLQPLICTYLINITQDPLSPSLYLMLAGIIGFCSLYFLEKKSLDQSILS